MKKKTKTNPIKKDDEVSMLETFFWFLKNPAKRKIKMPARVAQHLKVLGFLTIWFTIPALLLSVLISPSPERPEIFQVQPSPGTSRRLASPLASTGGGEVYFKIKLKGVQAKNVANQEVFVKAVHQKDSLYNFTFESLSVWQDEANPELFRGKLSLSDSHFRDDFTFFIKGPVHLQRKFESVSLVKEEELDFTEKPLLPGDLILPDTGQDDKVDDLDRDYLFSLVTKGQKPTKDELKAADLDLDAKITGRDYSLLIDTGVGMVGEK